MLTLAQKIFLKQRRVLHVNSERRKNIFTDKLVKVYEEMLTFLPFSKWRCAAELSCLNYCMMKF